MEYKGKLYGKIGDKTFDTGKTSDDWDSMELENKKLKSLLQNIVAEFQPMKILNGHKKGELISKAEQYLKTTSNS